MVQAGELISNRYEIIEKIGTGGMSVVYKAKCTVLQRFVAIKILREEFSFDEEFVKKFKVEAQSAASLSHSHIVNIFDVGNDGRIHYIVMEYLEGITLKEYIRDNGSLDDTETMKISACIAAALEHAHDNHIVHRDIKPQNIMITKDGSVKVMDFGIAKITSEATKTATEMASGSVHYIAPEQAKGIYSDAKSDIYSLGITMYEMTTGKLPFEADTAVSVALKHIHEDLPTISEEQTVSKALELIILKATQKRVEMRYQTAGELLADLKRATNFPNEEFVSITRFDDPSPTLIMSDKQVNTIREKSKKVESGNKGKQKKGGKLIVIGGVVSAVLVVGIITFFGLRYVNQKFIPKEILIPAVEGKSLDEAIALFDNQQILYEVVKESYNDDIAKDYIIDQDIEGLMVIEPEETVTVQLEVSKGVQYFQVPNVVNMEYNVARKAIKDAKLKVKMVTEYHDIIPIGDVIRQEPEGNTEVVHDSEVTIYVSNGKEEKFVEMPKITNTPESEAISIIKGAGFEVGNITYIHHDVVREGNVITTNVDPGDSVKEGYIINLVVSKGKTLVATKVEINAVILPIGQESGLVEVIYTNEKGQESKVYNKEVALHEFPIIFTIEGRGTGRIDVYLDGIKNSSNTINFDEVGN